MAILNNNPLIGSGGQQGYSINNSLRFRSSASAYLNRTPASAGNRRTWTWSAWVKLGRPSDFYALFGSTNNCFIGYGQSTGGANLGISDGNTSTMNVQTTALFRDPSAWYHFVVALDTPQATASNRVKIYVNGVQQTAFVASTYPSQNAEFNINNTTAQNIGRTWDGFQFFDGYMADVNFIDGSAKTPSDFGETDTTTGVWKPKAYSGTYGTNGFYLKFSDIATTSGSNAGLGKDFSGNTNYWTTNNISVTSGVTYDAMTDSPTNTSATVANYPTLNPLSNTSTLTEANLTATNIELVGSTMATPTTGKWYFEYTQTTSIPSGSLWVGVSSSLNTIPDNQLQGYAYASDGRKIAYNVATSGYGATWTNGDVIGCALDLDNQTITFYKNNVSQGTAFTSITAQPYVFALSRGGVPSTKGGSINFGQRPFAYTPPTGYVALNTFNLPNSTVVKGNTVMDATLYTGTGATQTITNAGSFRPDLVWVKVRSTTGTHVLTDSNRGANKQLFSNLTNAEASATNKITGFTSTGFTLGADDGTGTGDANFNGSTYVGWQWQAGQGSTSSNTSGTITSTVSVNTTAGFSVLTYTGNNTLSTIGHGLGASPKFIIVKTRSGTDGWVVYHASLGVQYYSFLNTTDASYNNLANYWGSTAPSSTTFSINAYGGVNTNGATYVAYCWAEIAGFSRFTSYTGNGSADGVFVYLGFRPKFVMIKRTDTTNDWNILNSSQQTYNQVETYLLANLSNAEGSSGNSTDFLSNGFKLRTANAWGNASGGTYIVAAWAENPFKNSNAR